MAKIEPSTASTGLSIVQQSTLKDQYTSRWPWDLRRSALALANNPILYLSFHFLGLLTLFLEVAQAFSTAVGLTRTVTDSLNYLSRRSPIIHPLLPTSSITSLKGCVSWATMPKRPVSAVCISATSLRSPPLHSGFNHRQANRTCSAHRFPSLWHRRGIPHHPSPPVHRCALVWLPYIELAETSYTIGGGHVSLIE